MYEDFAPKLASVLTDYCRPVRKGDYTLITSTIAAEPLIQALYEAVLRRGGNPTIRVQLPDLNEIYYKVATDEQFDFIDPAQKTAYETLDAYFYIMAPTNTKGLASADPARIARAQQGKRVLSELYLGRCMTDDLRWNITAWPTHAAAQDANMGYMSYVEFVYHACGLHHDDPVAHWTEFRERQDRLIARLAGKQHAEVHGPGINLSFDFGGRTWINCYGVRNFPDGEIYTCPIEDSVNGTVAFNLPTVYSGRELDGVQLVFRDGTVIDACAEKGEDYLLSQLDLDEGARRLGEFAIGTNMGIQQFTRNILFDEKMGGTIHMALGANAGETGGVNESVIHWDMVHRMSDGGEITIDGQPFYRSGEFVQA